ncbi:TonB-dependent receptor plug [Granulicella sp. WH15]|uniref:TonB-dependent receptor n=1 Tax=Granulicella sp. WH15 TaxID=2602070 RepID=UPI001366EEE5|nr:carboxypeptidase regulatory-like domain-containing protein [Granulicella sp. WH15]QHN02900.1 TonB-dependent receptor plug [Granulicella sp. WH15]
MRRNHRIIRSFVAPAVLAVTLSVGGVGHMLAQAAIGGGLRGAIVDASGASIPDATIVLKSTGTGAVHTLKASSAGLFSVRDIDPGVYSMSVTSPGFQEKRFAQVTFVLNEIRELNVTLSAGSVSEVVEVQAEQTSVVSQETSVGTLIDGAKIRDLPLNGRDFQSLVFLAPGATRTVSSTGQGSGVSTGGARPTDNNNLIDGGDANDPRVPSGSAGNIGNATSSVPIDAIAEFSVITSNASAEFGRSSGGIVNVVTKSGTNQLHATVWEYLRNSVFNTRQFFNPVGFKSPFKQNQFGFYAGGPIWRDRTFISTAYEGFRQRSTTASQIPIPTSQFLSALTPNSLASALFTSAYPAQAGPLPFSPTDPSTWSTTINRNIANNVDADTGFVRLDHKVSNNNNIFATYSLVDAVPTAAKNGGNLPTFGVGNVTRPSHIVVADNHVFSANLLNSFRFSFQRTPSNNPTEALTAAELAAGSFRTQGPNAGANYSANVGDPNGFPTLSFASARFNTIGVANNFPQNRTPVVWNYSDTLSYSKGKHEIKFGGQLARVWDNTVFSSIIRPSVALLDTSTVAATGSLTAAQASAQQNFNNINNLALNSQQESFYTSPSFRQYRIWEQGYFVQDSYRFSKKLTFDIGLRYEIFSPFTEKNNLLSNAYILDGNGKPEACQGLPFDANLSNVAAINPATYGIGNYCSQFKNFSPRVGFAYDVFGTGTTVVRGGYGYFYDRIFGNVYGNARFNPPQTLSTSISSGNYTGAIASATVNTTQSYTLTNIDPSLRNPATQHFNIAVSQQLDSATALTISYVGALADHLLTTTRPNFGTTFADAFRPSNQGATVRSAGDISNNIIRPLFSTMTYHQSNGTSNYNALLVNVHRQMRKGIAIEASYGWSHSHDVLSDDVSAGADSATPAATLENLLAPYMVPNGAYTKGTSCATAQSSTAASAAVLTAAVQCAEGNPNLTQAQAQTLFLQKYVKYANIKTNYGDSAFDVRQRFATSVNYMLPIGKGHVFLSNTGPVVDHVIGGWGLASIFDTQTGTPFIPTSGNDANRDGDTTDRAVLVKPVANRKGVQTKNVAGKTPTVTYFSAASFGTGDGIVDPTLRIHRGYLRNPGLLNMDFQLNKQTHITERYNMRFTVDFFNVLNHTNFSNLTPSIASSQFGQSLSVRSLGQTTSRQIQFGAKFFF